MQHIKKINFSDEKKLRGFLLDHPEAIEKGLTIIKDEVYLRNLNRVDILGQDKNGKIVLIELKAVEADSDTFVQILDYADFVYRNYRLVYEKHKRLEKLEGFDPTSDIRLMVIAPSFHDSFLRLSQHSRLEIEPIKYIALKTSDGAKGLTFVSEETLELPHVTMNDILDITEHIEWVTDDDARKATEQLVDHLKQFENVTIESTQNYLSIKKNKVYKFAQIDTKRNYCQIWYKRFTKSNWAWYGIKLYAPADLTPKIFERLKTSSESCVS